MAKPATLQLLKHGKLLCKSVFPFFVESYNWLLSAFDNLRGDFDVNPKNGAITIDKTDPDHPVIRLRTDNLNVNGGGHAGPFEPTFAANGTITSFGPGLWPYGRKFFSTVTVESSALVSTGMIGIEITHETTSAIASAKIISLGGFGDVDNTDTTKTQIPLYTIADGAIAIDLRPLMYMAIRE